MTYIGLVMNIRHEPDWFAYMAAPLECGWNVLNTAIMENSAVLRGTGLHPSTVSKENVIIHTILPSAKELFTTKPMRSLQIFPQFQDKKGGTNKETPGFIEWCCSKSLGRWATAGLDREFLLARSRESWIVANKQQPSGWLCLATLTLGFLNKSIKSMKQKNIRPSSNIGKWRFRSDPCTKLTN